MLLVDLNYNFECDWFVELSDNKLSDNKLADDKLSDNNLASELVGNRSFFKPITIEEILIFMIIIIIIIIIIITKIIIIINFIFIASVSLTVLGALQYHKTHFLFNGSFYDQIEGVAMGSPLAPVLVNLFMGHHGKLWLENFQGSEILFYRRHVDDTFLFIFPGA